MESNQSNSMFFQTSERIKNFKNRFSILKNPLLGRPWYVFLWNYILYHKVMGAQLMSNPARQEKEWVSSVKIIHLTLQSTWNCMLLQKISTTALKWLNSARVASYQQAQIKNCAFLIVGCVRNLVLELVSSAYKADAARVPLKNFTVPQK